MARPLKQGETKHGVWKVKAKSISMKDVARAAGVSQPAVSYAYNQPSEVSESVREHILAVAERLGYPGPDIRGRSLRSGRVGAIGLVMMDKLSLAFGDPFMLALLQGISEAGDLANIPLTLFPLQSPAAALDLKRSAEGSLAIRGLVDGLILVTLPDDHPALIAAVKQNIPFVIVDSPRLSEADFVGIDDGSAAQTQIRHLLELGHRRIGIVVDRLSPDGYRGAVDRERLQTARERITRERLKGYCEAAAAFGLSFSDLEVIEAGGLDFESGRQAALTMLGPRRVSGVVTSSDVMALATLAAAANLGLPVPGSLSVIGFDDVPDASRANLTTIHQPMAERGARAAQLLIERLGERGVNRRKPKQELFPTELAVRSTTAKFAE